MGSSVRSRGSQDRISVESLGDGGNRLNGPAFNHRLMEVQRIFTDRYPARLVRSTNGIGDELLKPARKRDYRTDCLVAVRKGETMGALYYTILLPGNGENFTRAIMHVENLALKKNVEGEGVARLLVDEGFGRAREYADKNRTSLQLCIGELPLEWLTKSTENEGRAAAMTALFDPAVPTILQKDGGKRQIIYHARASADGPMPLIPVITFFNGSEIVSMSSEVRNETHLRVLDEIARTDWTNMPLVPLIGRGYAELDAGNGLQAPLQVVIRSVFRRSSEKDVDQVLGIQEGSHNSIRSSNPVTSTTGIPLCPIDLLPINDIVETGPREQHSGREASKNGRA
ncbi:Uncharacterised protein [Candidatus Burarchaeum australiense]|nr:Uncharacterised protein [Candidatus Burarchaeum australiense]